MPDTTEPGDDGRGDGGTQPPEPLDTQIDTKPPTNKSNTALVFLVGFVAGLLVGGVIGASCGGGSDGREVASASSTTMPGPVVQTTPDASARPPSEQPAPR